MNVAIIPARGGSKRIPGKNIRMFQGRPMMAWAIERARASELFDRIVVSTDSIEIAEVAKAWGAEVPFVRPAQLADDHTPTMAVVRHAVESIEQSGQRADYACQILPTASLLSVADLQAGFDALEEDAELNFAFGVARFDFPIFRALQIEGDGLVKMFWPENEMTRSQDLPPAYHDAGQFVWGRRDAWMACERIFSSRSRGIIVPADRVQDIDTEDDWKLAEWKFQALALN